MIRGLLRDAVAGLRARRARSLLAALGIALAASMLTSAAVVGYGLETGFSRSAGAADLPDVIARFDSQRLSTIAERVDALPNVEATSFRLEFTGNGMSAAGGHRASNASVEVVDEGRRGYAIVDGRDLRSGPDDVLLEKGLAAAWGLGVGDTVRIRDFGTMHVVGLTVTPDNVAFPLAVPRVYVSLRGIEQRFLNGRKVANPRVNVAQIWVHDQARLDETLVQARATSFGIKGLRFVTRDGVRVLIDQAAGIVIALLVALSVMALLTAGIMLAAAARAEVQRRLETIGMQRALGMTRGRVAVVAGVESLLVALPAALVGVTLGYVAVAGAGNRLLEILNELPPGRAVAWPLAGALLVAVTIPVAASAWPSWRAAGRPPVELLRGAELRTPSGKRRGGKGPRGGLGALGARLVAARRTRLAATLTVLGASTGFILLMLALAAELKALENDPSALGKRYALTVQVSATANPVATVRRLPGVAAAARRYETQALDSFALGETIDVVAYQGNHVTFEDPPVTRGRRLRGGNEAEVGSGLASALGLSVGSVLAIQLDSGKEARFKVVGIVSALAHDGRVAYVPSSALLAAAPATPGSIAVQLASGANVATVAREIGAIGGTTDFAAGATSRNTVLIDALTAILRAVAIVDGLVCLYTLVQALTLTARERRRTISVLRATGADDVAIRRLLTGAALVVVVPAAVVGIVLEHFVLGPVMARLAASYATLPLGAGWLEIGLVLAGLALIASVAVVWVARGTSKEPIVRGLSG